MIEWVLVRDLVHEFKVLSRYQSTHSLGPRYTFVKHPANEFYGLSELLEGCPRQFYCPLSKEPRERATAAVEAKCYMSQAHDCNIWLSLNRRFLDGENIANPTTAVPYSME